MFPLTLKEQIRRRKARELLYGLLTEEYVLQGLKNKVEIDLIKGNVIDAENVLEKEETKDE